MRRHKAEQDAAPAGGRRTLLSSFRAVTGLRPGTLLRCPAGSWLIAGHASVAWLLEARPVIDKTLPWRAERRRVLATTRAITLSRADRRAIPSCLERGRGTTAYSGPQRIRAAKRCLRLFEFLNRREAAALALPSPRAAGRG